VSHVNELKYNKGRYEMAITFFSEAIKFNPKEYKLFGNRSFCFEKMQQFEEALSDAEVSLSMEPNWIKGLFRKGKALCGLKNFHLYTKNKPQTKERIQPPAPVSKKQGKP
uniref:Uncharacterized protein n=1 Tax=Periophthalmus magnuspinnatus TaxID=409849 RepID=A0A3B4A9Z4_9GOBI